MKCAALCAPDPSPRKREDESASDKWDQQVTPRTLTLTLAEELAQGKDGVRIVDIQNARENVQSPVLARAHHKIFRVRHSFEPGLAEHYGCKRAVRQRQTTALGSRERTKRPRLMCSVTVRT